MNTSQVISSNAPLSDKLLIESSVRTNYMWNNIIIEKRRSVSFLDKLYKGSVLNAFWSVLSLPVI